MPNRYLLEKVTAFTPLEARRVQVVFADGFAGEVDLEPLIDGGELFATWRDDGFFRGVTVRHGVPEWSDDVDLSPGALRAWCEAGRVLDCEETDAWVAGQTASAPSFVHTT